MSTEPANNHGKIGLGWIIRFVAIVVSVVLIAAALMEVGKQGLSVNPSTQPSASLGDNEPGTETVYVEPQDLIPLSEQDYPGITAPTPPARAWEMPEWPTRTWVYIPFLPVVPKPNHRSNLPSSRLQPEPGTVRVRMYLPGGTAGLRITTAKNGTPVQHETPVTDWKQGEVDIFFPRQGREQWYIIYSGNPKAKAITKKPFKRSSVRLQLQTFRGRNLRNMRWRDTSSGARLFVSQLNSARPFGNPKRVDNVNHTRNMLGSTRGDNDNYISFYQGWFTVRQKGPYVFGTDSDTGSVLLVDGAPAVSYANNSRRMAVEEFSRFDGNKRTVLNLEPGVHRFTYYHFEDNREQAARAAWRPPGAVRLELIAPETFMTYLEAHPVITEERSTAPQARTSPYAGFHYTVRRTYVNVPGLETDLAELVLSAHGAGPYTWSVEGMGEWTTESPSVQLTIPLPKDRKDMTKRLRPKITLSSALGRATRNIFTGWRAEVVNLDTEFHISGTSNAVFEGDRASIFVQVFNRALKPIEMEVRARYEPETGKPFTAVHPLTAMPERIHAVQVPFDSVSFGRTGRIHIALHLKGRAKPLIEHVVHVLDSQGPLPPLTAKGDHLLTPQGERVLLSLSKENPAARRRWAVANNSSRMLNNHPPRVLFFGSPFSQQPNSARTPLVDALQKVLSDANSKSTLRAKTWAAHQRPALGALAAIDAALGSAPEENTVVISLGLDDVRADTPELDYARMIDAVVDRIRRAKPVMRIVLVGPPPEVGRSLRSSRYSVLAAKLADDHHLIFINLHGKMGVGRRDGWERYYREPGFEHIHYTYPVDCARVAKWIFDGIK